VGRRPGAGQLEDDLFVQHVEVAVRTIGDGTAVERLGHEHEGPFACAGPIDDVLPRPRRQPLTEVGAQAIDAFARLLTSRCACRTAGFRQPVEHVFREVFPDIAGHRTVRTPQAVIIEHIVFVHVAAVVLRI
jgi:hypothetical protein